MRLPKFLALALALAASAAAAAPAPATDQEAWNLAVQVSDRLQPSDKLKALAKKMIAGARGAERAIESMPVGSPPWSTTSLLVSLEEGAEPAEVMAPFAAELGPSELKRYSFGTSGVLRWERPANAPALVKMLTKRLGVKSATLDSLIGISSSVSLEAVDGGYRMTFFQGSGDCPAGCINKSFWRFLFDGQGNLIGQEIDGDGPRQGGPGTVPGLGVMPAPGPPGQGGRKMPEFLPEVGAGLDLEPPEDPNADVSFPAPGRPKPRPR